MRTTLDVFIAFCAAVLTYAAFVVVVVALTLREGSGFGCSGNGCGPIADWLNRATPWPAASAALAGCAVGLLLFRVVRRRRKR